MDKSFLSVSLDTQYELLYIAEKEFKINPFNIEKDFWMCWTLEKLFQKSRNQFVFKGGTTLSKVYEIIERYSEDVDITINYTKFIDEIDFDNINDKSILNEVLSIKRAFYNSSYANYDKCINGQFKLIPNSEDILALKLDYQAMIDNGFFSKILQFLKKCLIILRYLNKKLIIIMV
ncbi:MAG: hypothetical protein QG673_456 [Pseudomonadota bacterium]|nr:hypothetical protein [Pseudomonadota bacterium]